MIRENFNGDRNTFMKTSGAKLLSRRIQKNGAGKNDCAGDAAQECGTNTIISPNKIQDYIARMPPSHQQGAG